MARRFARAWYPELLITAFLVLIGVAAQKDGLVFVLVEGVFGAGAWLAGRRHRLMPLHRKIDRVQDTADDIRRMLVQDEPDVRNTTHLRVVRNGH